MVFPISAGRLGGEAICSMDVGSKWVPTEYWYLATDQLPAYIDQVELRGLAVKGKDPQ